MAHRPPSSLFTSKWTYDVFLSFYGEDTHLSFTNHLHQSLHRRGIRAILADECTRAGENITPTVFRAIEESRIAIIVFSINYANSTFCLRELEKILECFKEESRLIYPIFYLVDPSELRNPRESYAKALAQLEKRFKNEVQKVEKWRQALSQAADLKGYHLKPKIANEQECITMIVNEVAAKINQEPLHVTNYPVGLLPRVKDVISCLDLWSTEKVKMIGIWGAGGIGKSTIARALYNSIADNFEGLCFLSHIRKRSKEPNGLSHLQETLLSKLVMAKDLNFDDYHEGIPIIQRRLSQKKILLILDDVDESKQLQALAGSCNWFGCGSRIIITTKDKQLLKSHGIESIYDVEGLNSEESLKLLSWYAFKTENVDSNYVEVCNSAVDYSCGFPLALEVIGSNLGDKGVILWNSALQQFKTTPNERVFYALKVSYDTLGEVEKQVFLDLACFYNGEELTNVIDILLSVHAIEPKYAIDTLIDKSLIKIEQARVTMHGLIEDVGKEIARQESPNEPSQQSRLWFYRDVPCLTTRHSFSQREIGDGGSAFVHVASNRVTGALNAVKKDDAAAAANSISESTNFSICEKGERIGAGGHGIVYVACNRETGALCAVKELKDIDNPENMKPSLQKEIEILSQLEHTNVVKYYGHEIVGRDIFLYMEYIQLGSLKKYILERGVLPESLIQNFTAQILSGLVYLHGKKVVHRDIKPDNVLIDSNKTVKLVNFGLSKQLEESGGRHSVLGTPYYIAPEVVDKKYQSLHEACVADIWSLGCVIIEMFSGKHPWLGFERVQVIDKVGKKQHPPIPKKLCEEGNDFLKLCFTRTPAERPSALALLDHPFVKPETTSLTGGRKYN